MTLYAVCLLLGGIYIEILHGIQSLRMVIGLYKHFLEVDKKLLLLQGDLGGIFNILGGDIIGHFD